MILIQWGEKGAVAGDLATDSSVHVFGRMGQGWLDGERGEGKGNGLFAIGYRLSAIGYRLSAIGNSAASSR